LMESVFGFVACLNGEYADASAYEEVPDVEETVAKALAKRNVNSLTYEDDEWAKHGYQRMINGQSGEMYEARIYIGCTYYQRLKHFVSDKEHARARGTLTTLVRQPPEGRSRDGGLRFGEMERDCTIGQGAAEFLKDCLLRRSDDYEMVICNRCGAIATTQSCCKGCNTDDVSKVNCPYAFKLLCLEIGAMNIKIKLTAG
jgi:DNA-directed RNA polymerase II subunit RPB2